MPLVEEVVLPNLRRIDFAEKTLCDLLWVSGGGNDEDAAEVKEGAQGGSELRRSMSIVM